MLRAIDESKGATTTPQPGELERAVYESIAYSDVFDFPVTLAEIQRSLRIEATLEQVQAALSGEALRRLLFCEAPYYGLTGRQHTIEVRGRRRRHSQGLMREARRYGGLIARLPCVRMVAVTGSLAVENADAGEDIDYLIITAPGRVWTARTQTMIVVRLASLQGITLCPNYLLSEDALALSVHDLYTARELVQMRPLAGLGVHRRLIEANAWLQDFLPNASLPADVVAPGQQRRRPRLESRLAGGLGERLERWLFERKSAELRAQAGDNDEAVFDRTTCKGHFDRHRGRTGEALGARLQRLDEATR
jgi:hypothetical protein